MLTRAQQLLCQAAADSLQYSAAKQYSAPCYKVEPEEAFRMYAAMLREKQQQQQRPQEQQQQQQQQGPRAVQSQQVTMMGGIEQVQAHAAAGLQQAQHRQQQQQGQHEGGERGEQQQPAGVSAAVADLARLGHLRCDLDLVKCDVTLAGADAVVTVVLQPSLHAAPQAAAAGTLGRTAAAAGLAAVAAGQSSRQGADQEAHQRPHCHHQQQQPEETAAKSGTPMPSASATAGSDVGACDMSWYGPFLKMCHAELLLWQCNGAPVVATSSWQWDAAAGVLLLTAAVPLTQLQPLPLQQQEAVAYSNSQVAAAAATHGGGGGGASSSRSSSSRSAAVVEKLSWGAPYVGVAEVMLHRAAVAAAGLHSELQPNTTSSSSSGRGPPGPCLMVAAAVAVSCTAAAAAEATAEPLAAAGNGLCGTISSRGLAEGLAARGVLLTPATALMHLGPVEVPLHQWLLQQTEQLLLLPDGEGPHQEQEWRAGGKQHQQEECAEGRACKQNSKGEEVEAMEVDSGEHLAAAGAAAGYQENCCREATTPITARAAAAAGSRSLSSALSSGGFGTDFQQQQQQEEGVYVVPPTPGSVAGAVVVEESDCDSPHPFTLTQVPRGEAFGAAAVQQQQQPQMQEGQHQQQQEQLAPYGQQQQQQQVALPHRFIPELATLQEVGGKQDHQHQQQQENHKQRQYGEEQQLDQVMEQAGATATEDVGKAAHAKAAAAEQEEAAEEEDSAEKLFWLKRCDLLLQSVKTNLGGLPQLLQQQLGLVAVTRGSGPGDGVRKAWAPGRAGGDLGGPQPQPGTATAQGDGTFIAGGQTQSAAGVAGGETIAGSSDEPLSRTTWLELPSRGGATSSSNRNSSSSGSSRRVGSKKAFGRMKLVCHGFHVMEVELLARDKQELIGLRQVLQLGIQLMGAQVRGG